MDSNAGFLITIAGDCTDGEVRLVAGESEFEGRVEVCLNRRWGTVSSDGWTQTNTEVVCNDLGYEYSGKISHRDTFRFWSIVQHQKYHSDHTCIMHQVKDEIHLVTDHISADGTVVNPSIPRALSKPIYLENVVCSSSDLNLLECSFSKHSGHVNDVQHAIITCQQCKDYCMHSPHLYTPPTLTLYTSHIQPHVKMEI